MAALEGTLAVPRRALIVLKWNLVLALGDGVPVEVICEQLGRPWTPELLRQAFPDVVRKAGV